VLHAADLLTFMCSDGVPDRHIVSGQAQLLGTAPPSPSAPSSQRLAGLPPGSRRSWSGKFRRREYADQQAAGVNGE